MSEIKASMVKELRERTGAGMMDCKVALGENDGDIDAAIDWLRTQGLSVAAKKAGRVASEGLVGVVVDGSKGAIVEVNAETDFVARNRDFQNFVSEVAKLSLSTSGDLDEVMLSVSETSNKTVSEALTNMVATVGENLQLRRVKLLQTDRGIISSYVHNSLQPGLGKIGVLVCIESEGDNKRLEALGKQLAMHVAAANPSSLSRESLDEDEINREKNVLREQARDSGKSQEIIEKMVEGRLKKFYQEVCFLEQQFVVDAEYSVAQAIDKVAKELGCSIRIETFSRFALGEGIERLC